MNKYPEGFTQSDLIEIAAVLKDKKAEAFKAGSIGRVQYWHTLLDKVRGHIQARELAGAA